ncbi:MAG: Uma2 family endonuclease [Roseimicrobium sp.]
MLLSAPTRRPTRPQPAKRLMTAAEFSRLPEGPPYPELIEGELFFMASPDLFHQEICRNLMLLLWSHVKARGLGIVIAAPSDVQLDFLNVFQPDVYFIAKDRLHILDDHGPKGAPDLAVEVLSTGTVRKDRGKKKRVYARAGVKELWLVDRNARTVEVYVFTKSLDEPVAILGERERLRTSLLPGLSIPVASIFER